jgi:hypothetical protein
MSLSFTTLTSRERRQQAVDSFRAARLLMGFDPNTDTDSWEEPDTGEMSVSTRNAYSLIKMIGLDFPIPESCEYSAAEVLHRTSRFMTENAALENRVLSETTVSKSPNTCTFVDCGVDMEYFIRKSAGLCRLASDALEFEGMDAKIFVY